MSKEFGSTEYNIMYLMLTTCVWVYVCVCVCVTRVVTHRDFIDTSVHRSLAWILSHDVSSSSLLGYTNQSVQGVIQDYQLEVLQEGEIRYIPVL